jgi:ornithine--oxo-acid transaminase
MSETSRYLEQVDRVSAHNYHPLPVVLERGEGCWVWDIEGNKYLDMLAAYSAVNQGHRHPRIIAALKAQADRLTLTSRAFHNDQMGPFLEELCAVTGFDRALPMNTGAEAVETAIKAARKWGYTVKGVPEGQAEIIVCTDNFHGRTTTIVGFSSEDQYRQGFGPRTRSRPRSRRTRSAFSSSRSRARPASSSRPMATSDAASKCAGRTMCSC